MTEEETNKIAEGLMSALHTRLMEVEAWLHHKLREELKKIREAEDEH